MAPAVLSRVCHGTHNNVPHSNFTVRPAILHDFRRHKVKGADYPAILPTPDSTVRGTVVTGLTDGDIWRLDIFEGDEYERRRVRARLLTTVGDDAGEGNVESDEEVECETYVWITGRRRLEDDEWDFGEFVREKMSRWVGVEGEGEYKGRDSYRRSFAALFRLLCPMVTDWSVEVDEAVKDAAASDPTGGRGLNGHIGRAVEDSRGKDTQEVLSSAV